MVVVILLSIGGSDCLDLSGVRERTPKTQSGRLKYTQARWEHPGDSPVLGQVLHRLLQCTLLDHVQSFSGRLQEWSWASLMVYDTSLDATYINAVEPVIPHWTFPGGSSVGQFYNSEICVKEGN